MKKQVGITLVALVITIIILLILAGVAISMITGGEGLFAQANGAATKYNQAAKNEADLLNQLLNGNYFGEGTGQGGEAEQSYVGYYADLDPEDGKIDGIIFADLAIGGSGEWGTNGTYTIPVKTGLKEYYESQDSYTVGGFGTKAVLTPKEGSTGEDRFYIMSLENFGGTTEYTWYNAASGKMTDYAEATSVEFGAGRANTEKMIEYWNNKEYGEQNTHSTKKDMWGEIQGEVAEGWFVPSRAEWAAFGGKIRITRENFETYGLSGCYWSSSQNSTNSACEVDFWDVGGMSGDSTSLSWYVRLATTF